MNKLIVFSFLFTFFLASRVISVEAEVGKWTFTKEENYCFVLSLPLKEEGNYDPSNRGDTYVMVYRMNQRPEIIVMINAGYNYNIDKDIVMKIDGSNFELFSEGDDTAWSVNEDKKIILAMKKGRDMIIKGTSSRGTLTTDTYTLTGFTATYNRFDKDC